MVRPSLQWAPEPPALDLPPVYKVNVTPDCCGGFWRPWPWPLTFSSENWHSTYSCLGEIFVCFFCFRITSMYMTGGRTDGRVRRVVRGLAACRTATYQLGQSDLAINGIAANWGFRPPNLPYPLGDRGCCHSVTWDHVSVSSKWHLIPSSGFIRVHECDRRTDHATVTYVAVSGIT